MRPTDVCFPNNSTTSTRTRWFPVRSLELALEAARRVLGTRRLAGGEGRSRHPVLSPLQRAAFTLVGCFSRAGRVLSRETDAANL